MDNRKNSEWSLPFMAWELRLYLDTHPNDKKALEAYRKVCEKLDSCVGACDTMQNCMKGCDMSHWTWIDDPWPWQTEANITDSESEG